MDIGHLEEAARETALKHVATLFQRADQLEKVEQYRKKAARKQAAAEAMLKTAVQAQLEGAKTALVQLHSAIDDLKIVKESLSNIDQSFIDVAPSKNRLGTLREESLKHSQYAAAMENLEQIFRVPETTSATHKLIEEQRFLHAHKNLIDLERARDDLLLEMHRQQQAQGQNQNEMRLLEAYFHDVNLIGEELGKKVFYIIERCLDSLRADPAKVVTALRIIEREERFDTAAFDQQKQTGFLPPGRPRKWRARCFRELEAMVKRRVEMFQPENRATDKSWLALYLERCRIEVLKDLNTVRSFGEPCFPPDYKVFDSFVEMYHKAISTRLSEIASERLEKNELVQLLSWTTKTYWSDEFLGNSRLHCNVHELQKHPLLAPQALDKLSEHFLEYIRQDVTEWLGKTLDAEVNDWNKDEIPEADASLGYFYSALPSIVFQMVDDQVQLAKEIGEDAIQPVLNLCVQSVRTCAAKYRDAFEEYKVRHFQDRSRYKHFTHHMICVANNCQICIESCEVLRQHAKTLIPGDITQKSPTMSYVDHLREQFQTNVQLSLACLLGEVVQDIKVHLDEIMTKKWLTVSACVDTILATLEDYNNDHRHLKPVLAVQLLTQFQYRIVGEFFRAAETRRLQCSNDKEREQAAQKLKHQARQIEASFQRMCPKMHEDDVPKLTVVLADMAEILQLRDKSLLSLEVSTFVQKYPDISVEQLTGLIRVREDVDKTDSRQLAEDCLNMHRFRANQNSPFMKLFQP